MSRKIYRADLTDVSSDIGNESPDFVINIGKNKLTVISAKSTENRVSSMNASNLTSSYFENFSQYWFSRQNEFDEFNPGFEEQLTQNVKIEEDTEIEDNLSNYIINETGVVSEKWDSVLHIPVKVIEINERFVILDCYDVESGTIESREFQRSLFKKNLKMDQTLLLKISQRENKITHEFEEVNSNIYDRYFTFEPSTPTNLGKKI